MLGESGVYVVLETGYSSDDEVIGVAASLTGAMRYVLESGELLMWVKGNDPNDPDAGDMIPVKVDTVGAADAFRWVDESAYGNYSGNFKLGEGRMRAFFQDESTRFVVQWRQMTF
jgi:hypothetical protein